MRVADFVADFLSKLSSRVYGVCGAGAMHLNDAIANHPGIKTIACHHEQAAAMAAEADARVTGQTGIVSVTAGPGASNALTGVACAWVDSIPMLIIGGQVTSHTMIGHTGLRQLGMNELDMVSVMRPVTKYAVTVQSPKRIRYELAKAVKIATTGRKGPVFVEIPLDIQAADIDVDELDRFPPDENEFDFKLLKSKIEEVYRALDKAKRPIILIGNGVRNVQYQLMQVIDQLLIPVVSSWGAADIVPTYHRCYVGRCGLFGDRASNFTVQTADLILAIGTRFSVAQIGHTASLFAPHAKKIVVDIDEDEIFRKPTLDVDMGIVADAYSFLQMFSPKPHKNNKWMMRCASLKAKYPVINFEEKPVPDGINAYRFADQLSKRMGVNDVVITDVGFSFIPMFQALRLNGQQRLIHSAGVSPMGWALPASIGASISSGRQVICLTGDGGAMMNLQELQTIMHHNLNIKLFIFENDGYATMKITQNNHFKREVMSGPKSGMSLPDFVDIGRAFGIRTQEFSTHRALNLEWDKMFAYPGPAIAILHMEPTQVISPRVQARVEGGKFLPTPIEDMWPHLPREEFDSVVSN